MNNIEFIRSKENNDILTFEEKILLKRVRIEQSNIWNSEAFFILRKFILRIFKHQLLNFTTFQNNDSRQ